MRGFFESDPCFMISLKSVSKRYGPKTIIHNLSFAVAAGEIVGFLGPNGAGKTTTLRMIAGFTTASSGTVSVAGYDMAMQNTAAARHIGYLPERPPLYDTLDVSSYLRFVAKAKGIRRADIRHELERVTTACHLQDVFKREIYKLSKGYRQRVGLAQALLGQPKVLLLDEPTIGLDPGQIQETREVIRQFGEAQAVLFSTHILPEVTLICQRVAIINHGRLLAIDTPAGLQQALEQTKQVNLQVANAPVTALHEELSAIDGVRSVVINESDTQPNHHHIECQVDNEYEDITATIARTVASRWQLLHLAQRKPTLENVFLHYIETGAESHTSQEAA